MTRGFVTVATGSEQYYKIAANLLKSYRYYSDNPLPFAVIAEEENEYTALFDDVIIAENVKHSFMDKLLFIRLCPYDENIFLDADCLAYGDLNAYWDFFSGSTDFSAIGVNRELHSTDGTWYNVEDIWEYGKLITYKCRVHAGVMFARKCSALYKLYDDCNNIFANYDKLHFHTCANSYDECILGIAMPMNNMKTERENPSMLAAFPCLTSLKADMLHARLSYSTEWAGYTEKGILLHFGNFHTHEPLYIFNVECLDYLIKANGRKMTIVEKLWYERRLGYYFRNVRYSIIRFFRRAINKLLRQHKDI